MIADDSIFETPCSAVAYCCPTLSDRREYLEELQKTTRRANKVLWCTEGIPEIDDLLHFSQNKKILVILDDLPMFSDLKGLNSLVGMYGRHLSLDLVMAVQNPFLKSKSVDFSFLSRNLSGMLILGNRADALMFSLLNARLCPEKKNFLRNCLDDARENQGCNYIFLDLHPHAKLSRKYMTATRIFANERIGGTSPLFYLLESDK